MKTATIVLFVVLLAFFTQAKIPKKELCLMGCKLLKKSWERALCEVGCNELLADEEYRIQHIELDSDKGASSGGHSSSSHSSYSRPSSSYGSHSSYSKPSYSSYSSKPSHSSSSWSSQKPSYSHSYSQQQKKPSYSSSWSSQKPSYSQQKKPSYGYSQQQKKPSYSYSQQKKPSYSYSQQKKPSYSQQQKKPSYSQQQKKPSYSQQQQKKPSYSQQQQKKPSYTQQQQKKPAVQPKIETPKPTYQPKAGDVTMAQMKKIMPGANKEKLEKYLPYINAAMKEGNINTPKRQAAFLSQLAHESGSLRYMQELASGKAYEGRKDLGNTHTGDGVRYKGRGPIQLTGRANYRAAGKALGLDLEGHPEIAATPEVGFRVATWYWSTHKLNEKADLGTQAGFDKVTRGINGGLNGKKDRDQYYWRAREVLGN